MERRPAKPTPKPCPPPLIRDKRGRCVPPVNRINFLSPAQSNPGAPLGGPAGGLWPSGGGQPQPPAPIPCLAADILADCFAACAGVIDSISPGPVCDWTFFPDLGATGSITFTPGSMQFNSPTSQESSAASKPITISGLFDRTVQFTLQEYAPDPSQSLYVVNVTDAANANVLSITFNPTGSFTVITGPQGNATVYFGLFTQGPVGQHTIQVTVDGAGVPRGWVDGIEVPLAVVQTGFVFAGFNAEAVTTTFSHGGGPGPGADAVLSRLFITTGQIPPTRTFCCPTP